MSTETAAGRPLRLEGKVAIITGGAGGIGSTTARHFVREGAKVLIADLLEAEGKALANELGEAAESVYLDVTDVGSWAAAVERCEQRFGPPSVLLNLAGVMVVGPLLDTPIELYERAFQVNTLGCIKGIKAVAGPMRANGGGSIVNMSSGAGYVAVSGLSAYAGSKAAIAMVTRCVAMELGHEGIRVNVVHPGGVDTPMSRGSGLTGDVTEHYRSQPVARIGQTDDIAPLLVYLASDESAYCTGAAFVIDGGFSAGS
jgi:3alpha(or 20beta)-hydroxysteroid dehydrogenase